MPSSVGLELLWGGSSCDVVETLGRSGIYCVHTASQRGGKAWLPGTSAAVIGTDLFDFFFF